MNLRTSLNFKNKFHPFIYLYPALFFAGYFFSLDALLLSSCTIFSLYFFISKSNYRFVIISLLFLQLGYFTAQRDLLPAEKSYEVVYADDEIIELFQGDKYYYSKNADLSGIQSISFAKNSVRYEKSRKILTDFSYSYNSGIRNKFNKFLRENNASNLLIAFTTGERYFTPLENSVFLKTGTMHLVAISAFHIGILFFFFSFFRRIMLSLPFFTHANILIILTIFKIVAVTFYLYMIGFAVPTIRAALFILLFDFLIMTGRAPHNIFVFLFSLVSTCVLIPGSCTSYSFLMSAVSVFAVLMIWNKLPSSQIVKIIGVSVLISFFLIPLTMPLSGFISLISPLANITAIPLSSLIIPFTFLLQLVYFIDESYAIPLISILEPFFDILDANLKYFSNFADSTIIAGINPPFWVNFIFYISALSIFVVPKWAKPLILISLFGSSILFFVPILNQPGIKEIKALAGKAHCISDKNGSGVVIEKYHYSFYDMNEKKEANMIIALEREMAACGITSLSSIYLKEPVSEEIFRELKKRGRYKNTSIFNKKKEAYGKMRERKISF